LEQRFFTGLAKLSEVCLHTSLDAALSGCDVTAELPYIGFDALAAAIAPGRICPIAADAESNKMTAMVRKIFDIV
jgi:hypothetical protein